VIYFDVTKTSRSRHASGLLRVVRRLGEELGAAARPVRWETWDRRMDRGDWFLTAELFSEAERPGLGAFLRERRGQTAALFHDAIPLQWPHVTWPQSVARHPGYLKLLGEFSRVAAVSRTSAEVLQEFWRWQGVTPFAEDVRAVMLGSDFDGSARGEPPPVPPQPIFVSVGIVEPRKNQLLLLEVAETLWGEGAQFELHLVGRVNPHFGRPMAERIKATRRRHDGLHFHAAPKDDILARLLGRARAVLFPTLAEGCGLPLLESLWRAVPCAASDLPVLRENADGGGCLLLPVNDRPAWAAGLRSILQDDTLWRRLAAEAAGRTLPTWADTAGAVRHWLDQKV
jgi:glycosyltransferase involved in cell wall biosynthesis